MDMLNAIKLAAAGQGIPPEAVDAVGKFIIGLNDLIQSGIDRNVAATLNDRIDSVIKLAQLEGCSDLADSLLTEIRAELEGEEVDSVSPEENTDTDVAPPTPDDLFRS